MAFVILCHNTHTGHTERVSEPFADNSDLGIPLPDSDWRDNILDIFTASDHSAVHCYYVQEINGGTDEAASV